MPLSESKLLVRVDAGIQAGTERVRSIHALAREFRQRGGQATIVCNEIPNALRRRIEHDCITVQQIANVAGSVDDCFETKEIIDQERPDWLAIDGAIFDGNYINQIAAAIKYVAIIDGSPRGQADLLVGDGEADSANANWDGFGDQVERLTGPDFSMVDSLQARQPLDRKAVAQAKKILVWIAGADIDNWTLQTLQSLSDLTSKGTASKRLIVDCLVGPQYKHLAELENFKRHSNASLRIHKNLDRIEPLAERAELAIASGHTGCYSLAYFGIPTILISTPESNTNIIAALHQNRAAFSIAHETHPNTDRTPTIVDTIKNLLQDQFKRHSLSHHAMDLVDGQGIKRIVNRMACCSLSLRLAEDADCATIWHWRNDPEVRSVALDREPIAWSTHSNWFDEAQADPNQQIWITENAAGQTIGEIDFRFDDHHNQAEINMILDQKCRSRGAGVLLIETALKHLFATTDIKYVVAQMRSGNIASEKSFRAAGFQAIAPAIVDGVMASQFLFERDSEANRFTKAA